MSGSDSSEEIRIQSRSSPKEFAKFGYVLNRGHLNLVLSYNEVGLKQYTSIRDKFIYCIVSLGIGILKSMQQ